MGASPILSILNYIYLSLNLQERLLLLRSVYKTDGVLLQCAVLDYHLVDNNRASRLLALGELVFTVAIRTLSIQVRESSRILLFVMENIHASNRVDAIRIDSDKTTTSFVKDAPKITRYSLADSADGSNSDMDYHIQIITKDDQMRVIKFLRRFFFRDEPLNQSVQLIPEGEDSTCVELEDYCSHASFDNNLSLMAVSANGAIVGVQLNGKMDPPSNEEPEYIRLCKNAKFRKILRLLHHIDKGANKEGKFRDSNVLEIRILSVDTNWRGQGIAKTLMEKTAEIAKEQGFHYLRADCTSFFSGKLCQRLGYDPIYKVNYNDYVDEDGKPIFSPASPHIAAITYIKKL